MVRTYRILPDQLNTANNKLRFVNRIETPPAAGLFAKVSNKPTNHSKSTGLTNTNSKAKKSKRRNTNKDYTYKAGLVDGGHLIGASASSVLSRFYQLDESYEGDDYGSGNSVYEIEVNDLITDENYYSEDDEIEEEDNLRIHPLTTTVLEHVDDQSDVDHPEIEKEAPEEDEDEIFIDEDGGSVTIGELVVLLEQVDEEDDWCFVGADQF